jgi:hypothetical protein
MAGGLRHVLLALSGRPYATQVRDDERERKRERQRQRERESRL